MLIWLKYSKNSQRVDWMLIYCFFFLEGNNFGPILHVESSPTTCRTREKAPRKADLLIVLKIWNQSDVVVLKGVRPRRLTSDVVRAYLTEVHGGGGDIVPTELLAGLCVHFSIIMVYSVLNLRVMGGVKYTLRPPLKYALEIWGQKKKKIADLLTIIIMFVF